MSTDINNHLNCVLESHKIKKEQVLLDKHISKRNEIKEALEEKYGANIYTPFNSGSYAKNTAVNTKFDFDFMVPFKRDAFDTLENMFIDIFDFLDDKYRTSAIVKKQKVSIGLEFFPDEIGDVIKIDVVPGRELKKDQYSTDKNLNLFVYNQFGSFQKGSERIQSNIHAQVEKIRKSADAQSLRQVIRLIKVWKLYNNKSIKSFFIELISIRAFEDKKPEGDLWEILEVVLIYIKDNIETIALPDPGNTNNDVADSITSSDKSVLNSDIKNMLDQIEKNSDFIKTYFPPNSKFPCEDINKSNNTYEVKKEGLSIPPPTRFGNI
jgi:hypothetical protein